MKLNKIILIILLLCYICTIFIFVGCDSDDLTSYIYSSNENQSQEESNNS